MAPSAAAAWRASSRPSRRRQSASSGMASVIFSRPTATMASPRIPASSSCSERTSARRLAKLTETKAARRKASTRMSRSRCSRNSLRSWIGMSRSQATRISSVARWRRASPERSASRTGPAASATACRRRSSVTTMRVSRLGWMASAKSCPIWSSPPASNSPRQAESRTSSSPSFRASRSRPPATRRQGSYTHA